MGIPQRGAVALACAAVALAAESGTAAASAAPKTCQPSIYAGQQWAVAARGVSCLYAKTWLPDMYKARSLPGGKWTGPPGWICVKIERDTKHVSRGVCVAAGGREMAWMLISRK